MQKIYTDIELIRYLYDEMSPEEKRELEDHLEGDLELKENYNILKNVHCLLSGAVENPSLTTIDLILDHSKSRSNLRTRSEV